ncbi:MAG: TraR/DksA family transcriptional regulator [Phycisphaerae bacterium]
MTGYTTSTAWTTETQPRDLPLPAVAHERSGNSPLALDLLDELRRLLLERRASLSQQIAALEAEAARHQSAQSADPADRRRDAWECALSRTNINRKMSLLWEVDQALRRMDDGTYGLDVTTGSLIPIERLREIPWARYA